LSASARRHLPTLLSVAVFAALIAGPALSHDADGGGHDGFAHNADKVDGKHAVGFGATKAARKGKLVATDPETGFLPNNIVAKARDADKLDGQDSSAFYAAGSTVVDSAQLDGLGPSAFVQKTGAITVSTQGPWQTASPATTLTSLSLTSAQYSRSSDGDSILYLYPDMQLGIYGNAFQLVGVRYCADSNDGDVVLSKVTLAETSTAADDGDEFVDASESDETPRQEDACRILMMSEPRESFGDLSVVALELKFTTTAATTFSVGHTTFILEATGNTIQPPE
jgi:hypothetical protein